MRGQPFLQLVLVVLAFAALGLPVWRLTQPAAANASVETTTAPDTDAPQPNTAAAVELTVSVAFAPAPEEFRLQHLGRDLLAGRGPQTGWTGPWKTALPAEGADLALQVRWPATGDNAPAAARVAVRFPDDARPPVERTFWSEKGSTLTELVTVPGTAP